jgi:fluoroquinolone resistance protein
MDLIEDKVFEPGATGAAPLRKATYEACRFNNLDLTGADLSGFQFIDCSFANCNFGSVKLTGTSFRDAVFERCKLLGMPFDQCSAFGLSFRFSQCGLDHSSFYKLQLKKPVFSHCRMQETDLTGADLSASTFDHCDLLNAKFEGTNIEKADLRTAYNFTIDPESNRCKKAKFSREGLEGLLGKYGLDIS